MNSKPVKAAVVSVSCLVFMFAIWGGLNVHASASKSDGAYKEIGVYSEVLSRIRSEYVEEPNISQVTNGALHGLLESLDANSSYLTPAEYKTYKAHKNRAKGDIGAVVSKRFGYADVISVIPGSPAEKAGLEDGDIIEAIEGKSSREMSLAEIHDLIAGEPGSNVNFSVVRARKAEPQKMSITRAIIAIPASAEKMMEAGVGYIKVDALNKGKAQEIAGKIKALQHDGAKKLVLDLRDVAEGDPGEAVATANLFLDHGVITYLAGQRFERQNFNADPEKTVTKLPLVVLVNHGTAGPGEIVAAAVLDNARGDVLGEKTFGDASVQKLIEIPDGSALILSVAKYHSPAGKAIEDASVTPNIVVAGQDEDLAVDEEGNPKDSEEPKNAAPKPDEQLLRAVEVLKNRPS
ncbi:MAG TPA: S41 family peptidase [Terriglobales bacterium]|nr:S41 family peptidase [Terriglobales bacterium]